MGFLYGIFMFVSIVILSFFVAALTATVDVCTGWTDGILHVLHDHGGLDAGMLLANSTTIYVMVLGLFLIGVFCTIKVMEAIDADFLWIVAIVLAGVVLAGPHIYGTYYHGGAAFTAPTTETVATTP